jgi:hypothetical protein
MLRYKVVSASEFEETYAETYPHAPSNQDKSEYLICGEGDMTEEEMNQYKLANWPQPEYELTKFDSI